MPTRPDRRRRRGLAEDGEAFDGTLVDDDTAVGRRLASEDDGPRVADPEPDRTRGAAGPISPARSSAGRVVTTVRTRRSPPETPSGRATR
jgi:hypothetical protein